MSDDPEEDARRRRKRRVTLKWNAVPLALPGEEGEGEAEDDPTEAPDITLPETPAFNDGRPSSRPPPPVGDGWVRQRSRPTPAAFRRTRPPMGFEEGGDALSLVDARSRPSQVGLDMRSEMHERLALGDFTAALSTAELLLGADPKDAEALEVSREARERLAGLYVSRLGGWQAVLRPLDVDVRWLGLGHRATFLLSRLGGGLTLGELRDLTGLDDIEVLRACVELLDAGAVEVRVSPATG